MTTAVGGTTASATLAAGPPSPTATSPPLATSDLTKPPEWLMSFTRHVGGGPAQTSRDGQPLTTLAPDPSNPETSLIDPTTGEATAWDWGTSGTVEMNCFLCHIAQPNNEARLADLGQYGHSRRHGHRHPNPKRPPLANASV